ncbi:MAG TPA: ArsB/NhaD family transporter [Bacilli bacterium]|nr:ArsB/NhaD family transporter [Bacilli bacterium]
MAFTISVFAVTILMMIGSIIFFPSLKIGKIRFSPYWLIALLGASVLLLSGAVLGQEAIEGMFGGTLINPVKILTLFISFTIFSIFLDEIGFFSYVAALVALKAKQSQHVLFIAFYVLTSVLTVFTANDIVILTLTPFIIYFAKNAKINPLPYLVSEFVAANTWSMLFIIGNPTNIYLATSFGIDFVSYFLVMALPTISAGILSYGLMRLLFKRQLDAPLQPSGNPVRPSRGLMTIGLVHLGVSTILISISSYVGVEMWTLTLAGAISLFIAACIYLAVTKRKLLILKNVLRRVPYSLAPFMLSMTLLVIAIDKYDVPLLMAQSLAAWSPLFSYGFSSFLFSNIINNIPMSILFTEVLSSSASLNPISVYATIIGSNLGAILSPIGALAGIMWMSILKREGIEYSYGSFLRYGLTISLPLMLISLLGLGLFF